MIYENCTYKNKNFRIMINALTETIQDFQIELSNTPLLNFSRRNWITNKIKYYEDLMQKVIDKQKVVNNQKYETKQR